jgi:methyl farnesoate epoxidase/farnesoate epoxidase
VGDENKGRQPGVLQTSGKYWREQRRFLLRHLKDFGFGKSSMESTIQEEMTKLCTKLASFPQVKTRF